MVADPDCAIRSARGGGDLGSLVGREACMGKGLSWGAGGLYLDGKDLW